jgi:hypothetical protein
MQDGEQHGSSQWQKVATSGARHSVHGGMNRIFTSLGLGWDWANRVN